MEEEKVCIC